MGRRPKGLKEQAVTTVAGVKEAKEEYVGPAEAALVLHVSPKTINRWANQGRIPCIVTLGGHRRFRKEDIDAAVQRMTQQGASFLNPPG